MSNCILEVTKILFQLFPGVYFKVNFEDLSEDKHIFQAIKLNSKQVRLMYWSLSDKKVFYKVVTFSIIWYLICQGGGVKVLTLH